MPTGRHSGSFLRDMYTQGVGIGKTVAIAKYLGARRSYNNLFHHEVQEQFVRHFQGMRPWVHSGVELGIRGRLCDCYFVVWFRKLFSRA